jgi:2-oxo-4-hydroxy-4-carboxy-5-ureidoimidazoline decarboxylase
MTVTTLPSHELATLADLDALSAEQFTARLADVFEHSPWVPKRAASQRPFADVDSLHACMVEVVHQASAQEQLDLLCAHPELAGREAQQGDLTAASAQEQSRAGLNALTVAEMAHISALNTAYMARHGFPFIVCVGRHTKQSIFQEFERRVGNPSDAERLEALGQVALIAHLRLNQMFAH